jgi:hypothetical protein
LCLIYLYISRAQLELRNFGERRKAFECAVEILRRGISDARILVFPTAGLKDALSRIKSIVGWELPAGHDAR